MATIRDITIGALFFIALAFAFTVTYSSVYNNYSPSSSSNLTYTNQTATIVERSANIRTHLTNTTITGVALLDIPLTVAAGAYEAVLLLLDTMGTYTTLVSDLSNNLHLPLDTFLLIITAVIAILITYELVSMLIKYRV